MTIGNLSCAEVSPLHREDKCLRTVRAGYDTAVSVGLLLEMLVLLQPHLVGTIELLIPLYRTEISSGEQD